MGLNFNFILTTIIALMAIGFPLTDGINIPSIEYDLDLIDLKVVDLQVLFMDDNPRDFYDNSDLVKITVNLTNNGLDYFLLNDKMLKMWVMEPDFRKSSTDNEVLELVDNYSTIYDDELEVIYDNLQSRELFEECDHLNERIRLEQSKVFTVCFDILRKWNNEILNIDGHKKYYLVMMDNQHASSCPDCNKVLLSSTKDPTSKLYIPEWVQNLYDWNQKGLISEKDLQISLQYLVKSGIIFTDKEKTLSTLENKNLQLKEHQARLSLAQKTNLYVSLMNFFDAEFDDSFSGVLCKKQNNIVTLSGDYTNDKDSYETVFFKLLVFDELNNVVATGISKIVDVTPNDFRHFSISTPYKEKINNCHVMIDSKFP